MSTEPPANQSENQHRTSFSEEEGPKQLDRTGPESLRRGPWSPEEDQKLMAIIALYGPLNWVRISLLIKTRSPKQCRERYHQNLKPLLNRTPISYEEGLFIEQLVAKHGKKWAEIARHLSGRSDNAIKNWWNGGASRRRRASHVSLPLCRSTHQASLNPLSLPAPPMVMGPEGLHTPLPTGASSPSFPSNAAPQRLMTPNPPFLYSAGPPHLIPPQGPHAYTRPEPPLIAPTMRPEVSPKLYPKGPQPGELVPPAFNKMPSVPHVTFNTAMFNEGPRRDPKPDLLRLRSLDFALHRTQGPVFTPPMPPLPAPYHAGDVGALRPHGSWGSGSSLGSSYGGPLAGAPGPPDHYDHTPMRPLAPARLSTSSSTSSQALRQLPSGQDLGGPNVPVYGRPLYVPGPEPLGTEEQGVVPPFELLMQSISTPQPQAPPSTGSIRVSKLIN